MSLVIIAAFSDNNVIGNNGKIPWDIPEDRERFKELTLHHPVIMGRNTYDSILERNGKPLQKRINIVLTSSEIEERRVITEESLGKAIMNVRRYDKNIYIIGGERVYRNALPTVGQMELTRVYGKFEGDAFFPEVNWDKWQRTFEEEHDKFSFETYERK
tara:strand:- start:12665 stop:13141 length:477 start_codon:yes stop_codon:yes gene_type:complete